jgi:hypothetical protein
MTTKAVTGVDDLDAQVTAAESEAEAADGLVEALEERVRDGDLDVTPEQIESQRSLSRFARLRATAARRKAEKARTEIDVKAHDAAIVNARAVLAELSIDRLAESHAAAVRALIAFADTCVAHDEALAEAKEILRVGNVTVDSNDRGGDPRFEGVPLTSNFRDFISDVLAVTVLAAEHFPDPQMFQGVLWEVSRYGGKTELERASAALLSAERKSS